MVAVSAEEDDGVRGRLAIQKGLQLIRENISQEKRETEKAKGWRRTFLPLQSSPLTLYFSRFFNLGDGRWFRPEFLGGWFWFDIRRFGQGRQPKFVFDSRLDPEGVPPFRRVHLLAVQDEAKM